VFCDWYDSVNEITREVPLQGGMTVYDATPVIDSAATDNDLYAGDQSGDVIFTIMGHNLGASSQFIFCHSNTGACDPSTNYTTDIGFSISLGGEAEDIVQGQITASASASGSYDVAVISDGVGGSGFFAAQNTSNKKQVPGPTPLPPPTMSCPSAVRGANVTCTISGARATNVASWSFVGGGSGNVPPASVQGPKGALTWTGIAVASGTVSANVVGVTNPVTAAMTVTPRSWTTKPATPAEVANGTFYALPVPPVPPPGPLGYSQANIAYTAGQNQYTTLPATGPNGGFTYFATPFAFSTFSYLYEISPDLENQNSAFSQHQCGNYDSQSNPSGFISWVNLLAGDRRHEYNSTTQSHYAFYSTSLATNNFGNFVETQVAAPGTDLTGWATTVGNTLSGYITQISLDAFGTPGNPVEPYQVNYSETGVFEGFVNYAQPNYAACPN
jgi:hypothetical protein